MRSMLIMPEMQKMIANATLIKDNFPNKSVNLVNFCVQSGTFCVLFVMVYQHFPHGIQVSSVDSR